MQDDERYKRAKARVDELRSFYIHAAVYVVVNLFLIAINLIVSPDVLWFYWSLLGWGIGLAAHAITVFGASGRWARDWEERKIRELMTEEEERYSQARRARGQ
jgi:hypothetical protein